MRYIYWFPKRQRIFGYNLFKYTVLIVLVYLIISIYGAIHIVIEIWYLYTCKKLRIITDESNHSNVANAFKQTWSFCSVYLWQAFIQVNAFFSPKVKTVHGLMIVKTLRIDLYLLIDIMRQCKFLIIRDTFKVFLSQIRVHSYLQVMAMKQCESE